MNPSDFEGRVYGPVSWSATAAAVGDFVALTGDDPDRWQTHSPPGFAAAALFAVAPDLLAELYDRSVVHGEQTFEWARSMPIDVRCAVAGTVTRVRERAGVHFMTFEVEVGDDDGVIVTGRSLFLLSGEALPAGSGAVEHPEPPHSYRGAPAVGELSASRADLVRYAAATRDWNPVHWDHDAGVAAGFPGVVVHGLLQAGWALRAASQSTTGARPFASSRFRFRNPLLPARPAVLTVDAGDAGIDVTLASTDTEYMTATMTLSNE